MGLTDLKISITILGLSTLIACESVVRYQGTVLDTGGVPIENVEVLVMLNGKIEDSYGIEILDTIHYLKRDSINGLLESGTKKHLVNENGRYVMNAPYCTDSEGHFSLLISEGSVFGRPDYKLMFSKAEFEDYEMDGDWRSNETMTVTIVRR